MKRKKKKKRKKDEDEDEKEDENHYISYIVLLVDRNNKEFIFNILTSYRPLI